MRPRRVTFFQKNNSNGQARPPRGTQVVVDKNNINLENPGNIINETIDLSNDQDNNNDNIAKNGEASNNLMAIVGVISGLGPPTTEFNPDVSFFRFKAFEPETLHCIGNGNCAMDALMKGLWLLGRCKDQTHQDLRRQLPEWAL